MKQLSKIASQAMLHETGLIDPEIGASSPPPEPVQRTIESLRPSKEARKTPSQKTLVSNTAGDNHNHIENKIISEESSEQELLDSTTYSSSYSSSLILAAAAAADSSADSSVGMPQEETYESEDEEKGLSGIQATKSQSSECNEADIGDRVYASAKHHNGMWYWGVVKHKFVKRKRVCYSVSVMCCSETVDWVSIIRSCGLLMNYFKLNNNAFRFCLTMRSMSKLLLILPQNPWWMMAV